MVDNTSLLSLFDNTTHQLTFHEIIPCLYSHRTARCRQYPFDRNHSWELVAKRGGVVLTTKDVTSANDTAIAGGIILKAIIAHLPVCREDFGHEP